MVIARYHLPIANNAGATNITATAADLTGELVSTGTVAWAVAVYWGQSDGGTSVAAWANHHLWPAPQAPGSFSFTASSLPADATHYYRFAISNEQQIVWAPLSAHFITGNVWLEQLADASETGPVPGTVMVQRAASAAAGALPVYYRTGGTAAAGADYAPLGGTVVIPAGETNAAIAVTPYFDHLVEGAESVAITLLPGPYVLADGTNAVCMIEDAGQFTRTWRGTSNTLASVAANWLEGEAPVADDKIVLDAGSANKPLTWDLNTSVGAWQQTADYSGTVTFKTTYPGQGAFTNFVISGDAAVLGGTWTHPANSGGATAVERLCVSVASNFTLGAGAAINLNGKGYAANMGPGAGNNGTTTDGRSASHGGRGALTRPGKGTYGSAVYPEELGSGAYGAGGGALKLTVGGTATINGLITVQGTTTAGNDNYCHGSGGSILVMANAIAGSGRCNAGVDHSAYKSYHGSGGGRLALHAATTVNATNLTLEAYAYTAGRAGYNGAAGTICLRDAAGGRLIVDQGGFAVAAGASTDLPAALAPHAIHPAYTGELANAALVITNGGKALLTRDLRMGGVAWLAGTLALNAWTLYAQTPAPGGAFPADFGGGSVTSNGIFHTFDDGATVTRDGRLLWGNSNVAWRVVSLAYPPAGGSATFDSGATDGYYTPDSALTFSAAASNGYSFIRWDGTLDGGGGSTTQNPLTLAPLTGNRALRAWFLAAAGGTATNSWSATPSSADWYDPRNWSLMNAPAAGQTVILATAAGITLTSAPPALAEFILNGATLTFDGWETRIKAQTVKLLKGSVTHAPNSATEPPWTPNARVWFDCTDFILISPAAINASAKGYGPGDLAGYGPGGGYNVPPSDYYHTGGGGHGGRGGRWQQNAAYGQAYDETNAPALPGSGGANAANGMAGGGVVRIAASGQMIVNGSIAANGGTPGAYGSGGAGGSIWVECGTFAATNGELSAFGGNADTVNTGGGGGGGRIALLYNTAAQSNMPPVDVRLNARGGAGTRVFNLGDPGIGDPDGYGEPGTVALPDSQLVRSPLKHSGELVIPGYRSWQPASLNVTEGWCRFPPGFDLRVNGAVTISGASTRLELVDSAMSCATLTANQGGLIFDGRQGTGRVFNCSGDLIVTNAGQLHARGGVTNLDGTAWGVLIKVGGTMHITTNSLVRPWSHPYEGGSPLFRVRNLRLDIGGSFNANSLGYVRGLGRGGFGPGGGYSPSGDNYSNGGGGYGGRGGRRNVTDPGGGTYCSSNAPVLPGSGGGGLATGYVGQDGGGLIWIEAERLMTLNGTMTANGGNAGAYGSGGAGGGIYLRCARLEGAGGVLSAKGGGSHSINANGAGGGGRIAVWRRVHNYSGLPATSVNGGIGCYNGEAGTVVWGWVPMAGTMVLLR